MSDVFNDDVITSSLRHIANLTEIIIFPATEKRQWIFLKVVVENISQRQTHLWLKTKSAPAVSAAALPPGEPAVPTTVEPWPKKNNKKNVILKSKVNRCLLCWYIPTHFFGNLNCSYSYRAACPVYKNYFVWLHWTSEKRYSWFRQNLSKTWANEK